VQRLSSLPAWRDVRRRGRPPFDIHRMHASRRRFIFTGIAGAAAFAAARWLQPIAAPSSGRYAMRAGDADVMRAVIPALLDGALPADADARRSAVERTLAAVETAIAGLPPAARDELAAMFAMLSFAPVRIALAGVGRTWPEADSRDVDAFIVRLQTSRWQVKRAAYDALHQLTFAAWYADPSTWAAIGYAGPPQLR
jgi:hypothetical protein